MSLSEFECALLARGVEAIKDIAFHVEEEAGHQAMHAIKAVCIAVAARPAQTADARVKEAGRG